MALRRACHRGERIFSTGAADSPLYKAPVTFFRSSAANLANESSAVGSSSRPSRGNVNPHPFHYDPSTNRYGNSLIQGRPRHGDKTIPERNPARSRPQTGGTGFRMVTPRQERGERGDWPSGLSKWGLPGDRGSRGAYGERSDRPQRPDRPSRPAFGLRDPDRPAAPRGPPRERSFEPRSPRFAESRERTSGDAEFSSDPDATIASVDEGSDRGERPSRHYTKDSPRDRDRDRDERQTGSRSYRNLLNDSSEIYLPARGKGKGKERERPREVVASGSTRRDASVSRKKVVERKEEKEVFIPSTVPVGRLAEIFDVKLFNLQTRMMRLGMSEDQRRSDHRLTAEEACNIALEYGFNPIVDDERAFDIYPDPDPVDVVQPLRPPVVTIMGHVDHGKTTLLDSLRHTSVAASEAGGITQHIGAFSVPLSSLSPSTQEGTITFLDTPGHAAFTAMRARGASVTDLVVLVVAADDGVMPQTKEVIELVKSEGEKVGLVVAINKCDKPAVDVAKVKSALGAEGILLEEDGGDVPSVRVSGLAKIGLDDLVETLATLAELRDLRSRQDGKAEGYVLESRVDKGRGIIATVLVSKGTLKAGSCIVAGNTWARVRQMQDDKGKALREALPGTPVSITGWKDLPSAGDQLLEAVNGEDEAKRAVTNRLREAERKKMMLDVEQINVKRAEERKRAEEEQAALERVKAEGGDVHAHLMQREHGEKEQGAEGTGEPAKKELLLVIKGDVSGTVEAVVGSLEGIGNKEAGVKIIHTGVGELSESDIHLAEASGATVIGFSVPCPRAIQTLATDRNVPLHLDSVIYRLIEAVRAKTAALLPPLKETRVTGEATCSQVFEIKLKGKEMMRVAGCRVGNGVIGRQEGVRVVRGDEREVVYEGTIDTLKHVKKDVTEVRKGTECGISFVGWNDIREGDEVVTFTTFEVAREL